MSSATPSMVSSIAFHHSRRFHDRNPPHTRIWWNDPRLRLPPWPPRTKKEKPMRKWLPLTAVCLGAFMLLVDVTIVTVALPDMAADMHSGFAGLQWVMDVYALALAALLLGAGSLADRIGRRRVYLGGLALFAAASLACGLATGPGALIAFRALQGIGGAAMFATTMALLSSAYQGRDRGVAFGVWGAVNGAAAAAGPILGGVLTEQFGWRWIFFINLPVSALAVYVTLRAVGESRDPRAKGLDLPGMATFTAGAGTLTYALIRGGEDGWTSAATLGLFGLAAVAFASFVVAELRGSHPMLDLSLFRDPAFTGIMAGSLLLSGAAFSYLMYTSLWLQSAEGMGPVGAGLVLVPLSLAAFVVAAAAGRLLHGMPARLTVGGGLLLIGIGALLQALLLDAGDGWPALVPGLVVNGVGGGAATSALVSDEIFLCLRPGMNGRRRTIRYMHLGRRDLSHFQTLSNNLIYLYVFCF
ncbi:integral membrane efflux protein [Streptomyces sp. Mg1]|nr:integral membrane efflux protein [Streptomyces sp. Mg1]